MLYGMHNYIFYAISVTLLAVLVVVRHKANIQRLITNTEKSVDDDEIKNSPVEESSDK
jgi:glycerol-3-phosphate acyltransferase PlsY